MKLSKYNKFLVALVGFAVMALTTLFGATPPEWFNPLVSLLSALGVYQVSNK